MENGGHEALFENDLLKIGISTVVSPSSRSGRGPTNGPADFQIKAMEMKKDFQGEFSLAGLVEMYVILKGLSTSLAFLPFE